MNLPENYQKNNPNILKRIEQDLDTNSGFHYLFMGDVGCGKTYLAEIIAKNFENVRYNSAFELYSDYLFLLDSSYTDKNEAIKNLKHSLRGSFVILDDLGAESPRSESSRNFISAVCQDGYLWVKEVEKMKVTRSIITTNLTGMQIQKLYGVRVIDRLQELYTIMKFKSKSFRADEKEIIEG